MVSLTVNVVSLIGEAILYEFIHVPVNHAFAILINGFWIHVILRMHDRLNQKGGLFLNLKFILVWATMFFRVTKIIVRFYV